MPKTTKFELDFIPDPQMLIIFEKGTGSGIFHISNRYAMSKFFPTIGFKCIDPK